MSDSFVTSWTIACEVPLSMGFSRQECWSRLSFPFSGVLPDPGIEVASPTLAHGFFTSEPPRKPVKGNGGLAKLNLVPQTGEIFLGHLLCVELCQRDENHQISCRHCCSVARWCLTLCDPMDCSTSGFPVFHYFPEFAQTHVH